MTGAAGPNAGSEAVFEERGVTKVYDMGEVLVHALRGVNLKLHAGELLVVLGPSGSGKSTLLNIAAASTAPPAACSSSPT